MEHLNHVIFDLYDSAQHASPSEFNEHALGRFQKSVDFNSAVMVDLAVTPEKEFLMQSLNFYGTPIDRFQDRYAVFGSEKVDRNGSLNTRDIALRKAYDQRGKSVATDISKTFFDAQTLKYLKKYETAHSLTFVSSKISSGMVAAMSFGRAAKKDEFSKEQLHVSDILLPHLLQARKINRELTGNFSIGADNSSTLLANFDGSLHFVEEKAIKLLQLEWKQWQPPLLPRALIQALGGDREKVFIGASVNIKASVQGNMICLVINARKDPELALSNAEYRAAKLAAEGLQYKEIARQLGLSSATIRNQLHSVYVKLGVSNKVALANALSRQS